MTTILDDKALAEADAQVVMATFVNGLPLPTEVADRVRRRSERKTAELRRKVGVLNVAVDLVREGREEA